MLLEGELHNFMMFFFSGKLVHSELEEGGALDELKECLSDDALCILHQFIESNLENVSNTSAFLCGIMETYRYHNSSHHSGRCIIDYTIYIDKS